MIEREDCTSKQPLEPDQLDMLPFRLCPQNGNHIPTSDEFFGEIVKEVHLGVPYQVALSAVWETHFAHHNNY
jgi:hypothetical protein